MPALVLEGADLLPKPGSRPQRKNGAGLLCGLSWNYSAEISPTDFDGTIVRGSPSLQHHFSAIRIVGQVLLDLS